jgi:hypothetical protein
MKKVLITTAFILLSGIAQARVTQAYQDAMDECNRAKYTYRNCVDLNCDYNMLRNPEDLLKEAEDCSKNSQRLQSNVDMLVDLGLEARRVGKTMLDLEEEAKSQNPNFQETTINVLDYIADIVETAKSDREVESILLYRIAETYNINTMKRQLEKFIDECEDYINELNRELRK